jgi:hypothetical protein
MKNQKRIRIENDNNAESPREWCNLGTMMCWHGQYGLGDEQPSQTPHEKMASLVEEFEGDFNERLERRRDRIFSYTTKESIRESDEYEQEQMELAFDKYYISLPLYLYDHSGITMNTTGFSCRWDSGQVGFIYVSRSKVREEYGWNRITKAREQQILKYLEGEVETYDQFIRGDVYGFIVEERPEAVFDDEGTKVHFDEDELWEETDSCWGFFGRNPFENGISDHIEEELHPLLKEAA